jgi:hypothetical protein
MAIEFVCSSCQSKHAYAEHMAGKQFRCGGCGKILTVPAPGQEGITTQPRPPRRAPADDVDVGEQRAIAMGQGVQTTLLIVGAIMVGLLLFACLAGGVMFTWLREEPPARDAPMPAVPHEEEMKADPDAKPAVAPKN